MKRYLFLLLIALVGTAAIAGCLGGDDEEEDDTGNAYIIKVNGNEVRKDDIFETYEQREITDSNGDTYEGILLKEVLADNGITDLSGYTFRLIAADNWTKEVTHLDMEEGILVEEETMTVFPNLPGKYRVRDLVTIEVLTDGDTVTVNGQLWTWMQPFDILEEAVMYDNESNEYTGVRLSDMINYTALEDPQTHNFTIEASDGYSKEVTWEDMKNGILVDDEGHMTMFPHLAKQYWIKDVVEITVV